MVGSKNVLLFEGQHGVGSKKDVGLLSLKFEENFCMGGPGIVFSQETLRIGKL